jgi:pimeloyl-ACP methyl ester carboxylesterase
MSNLRQIPTTHSHTGYTVHGVGTPLVLLHSSMGSKVQWGSLIARMSDRYRVIAIDLFGYGDVPMPLGPHYSLSTEAARVKAILQRILAPGERYHLAGHSFGGGVALRLAHAERNRVISLALFEPTAFHLLDDGAPALAEIKLIAQQVRRGIASGNEMAATRAFIDYWGGEGSFDKFGHAKQLLMAAQLRKVDQDFHALMNDPHGATDYAAIACPMLVMLGSQGKACTCAIALELARHHPSCLLIETEGGHMAPLTHRDAVNAEIDVFITLAVQESKRAQRACA